MRCLDDIPTTFPDTTLFHGIRQLAMYIGMPMHELEQLIAWEPLPLTHEEKAALAAMVSLIANDVDKQFYEKNSNRIYTHYSDAMAKRLGVSGDQSEKATNRQIWQMGELVFFVGMCFERTPRWLAQWPVKLQSGSYEDAPKREKNLPEMITEMEQELNSLPNYTAYVKAGSWKGKISLPLPADLLPGEPIVDVSGSARENALNAHIVRKREEIEAEIRERQEKWREEPGDEPSPPTNTGGSTPPALPSDRSGQPEEPPPTSIPEKPPGNSNGAQPITDTGERDEAQSYREGRVIDFTAYARKRREEARPAHIPQEISDGPIFRRSQPRPPDVPLPSYEPLDYSSGSVTVQDFRDHLAPLVKAEILRYELLDSEPGDSLAVYSALALQDRMVGRRVLHRMLQRGGAMPYEEVGRLAAMVGETAIAEQIIQGSSTLNRGMVRLQ